MTNKDLQKATNNVPSITPLLQKGFEAEGLEAEDFLIPRAQLLQALSPDLQEGNIKGAKVGTIINSLTKEILPDTFIPVFVFKNWIRFNSRDINDPNYDPTIEKGKLIWSSADPSDPRVQAESKFGANGEKPAAITFLNFFSFFQGVSMPIIISFSKTSYKTGKRLLSLAKFCSGDMFSRKYKLLSKIETNDSGTFAVLKIEAAGKVNQKDYEYGLGLWKEFGHKIKDIKIHEEEDNTNFPLGE